MTSAPIMFGPKCCNYKKPPASDGASPDENNYYTFSEFHSCTTAASQMKLQAAG